MNKEVKVGLGVILALMIMFISTVGWRLYRSPWRRRFRRLEKMNWKSPNRRPKLETIRQPDRKMQVRRPADQG